MKLWMTATCVLIGFGSIGLSWTDSHDSLVGDWSGRLERAGLKWEIGLHVSRSAGGWQSALDVQELWLARQPLPSFRADENTCRFELPWSMGQFEGRADEGRILGEVTFRDGRKAPLELQRVHDPAPRRESLHWKTGEVSIAGTLRLPPGAGPFPAMVVLHGGGDSSRESPPYRFWSELLPRIGIACLIYDKRGNGQSKGDWRKVGFEERARDVGGGLAELRKRSDIDPERLGLLAVSQGSWVAGIAARLDDSVGFVVHISGPAVPVVEADTYAFESELRRGGADSAEIAEQLRLWKLDVDVARHPDSDEAWQRLQSAIGEARKRDWFERSPYESQRRSRWRTWYPLVLDHDPRPVLESLDVPMLWLFGARDSQSDPALNLATLEDLRRRGKDYTIGLYPEAGHGLLISKRLRGESGELLTAAPGFFPDLIRWLRSRVTERE